MSPTIISVFLDLFQKQSAVFVILTLPLLVWPSFESNKKAKTRTGIIIDISSWNFNESVSVDSSNNLLDS